MPTSTEFASALRAVADFVETHPLLPVPYLPSFDVWDASAEAIKAAATVHGVKKEKIYSGEEFYLRVRIPYTHNGVQETIRIGYNGKRADVCTRKVVSTKVVPEEYVPGYIRPARIEDVVEWDCGSILASGEDAETTENA